MIPQTLNYFFDTDTCIYLLNGNREIKAQVRSVGIETVSAMTKGELFFGAYNSGRVKENLKKIKIFFEEPGPKLLPLDDAVMDCFGKFKAELRRKGQPVGDIDLLIAGVAISRELKLVTNNIKHFNRIPGISLENWLTQDE